MSQQRSPNQALRKGFVDDKPARDTLLAQIVERINRLAASLSRELDALDDEYVSQPEGGSSTDNAIVRWDGATGTVLQDSGASVDDDGNVVLSEDGWIGIGSGDARVVFNGLSGEVEIEDAHLDMGLNEIKRCGKLTISGGGVVTSNNGYLFGVTGERLVKDSVAGQIDVLDADLDMNGNNLVTVGDVQVEADSWVGYSDASGRFIFKPLSGLIEVADAKIDMGGNDIDNIGNTTGGDLNLVTGTAGASGDLMAWDVDGNASVATADMLPDHASRHESGGADALALSLAQIDIDGGTDIGAALADADLLIVDDGAGGTNRKSAVSRIWTYVVSKIQALSAKATPVDADILTIQDSAASNELKELTVGNLWDNRYLTDAQAIRLDDFAAPEDNTDLDASTSAHGLCPKGDNNTGNFLRGDLTWAAPAGGGSGITAQSTNWVKYVSTSGNDTTGDGSSGTPWRTVNHALGELRKIKLVEGATATLYLKDGQYIENVIVDLPSNGQATTIRSENIHTLTYSSVATGGTLGAYTATFTVGSGEGANVTTGDALIVTNVSGSGNYKRHLGCHEVTGVSGDDITVTNTCSQSGLPTTLTGCTLKVPKGRIYGSAPITVNGGAINLADLILKATGTTTDSGIKTTFARVLITGVVGIHNVKYGVYADDNSTFESGGGGWNSTTNRLTICNYGTAAFLAATNSSAYIFGVFANGGTYTIWAFLDSAIQIAQSAISDCGTAFYASDGSVLDYGAGMSYNDYSTISSPAVGALGNNRSLIF